jgi:hypothetical protein
MREHGQNITTKAWEKHLAELKGGKIWNLTLLDKHDSGGERRLALQHQVVDFHEVLSLPVGFLTSWVRASGAPRLRLRPPYREHVSQSFARFFMRVGLPIDIKF